MAYDVERQVRQLFQVLAQDKKPIAFLIGAGCPVSIDDGSGNPLIPDIAGITEVVLEQVRATDQKDLLERILDRLQDEEDEPSIEDVLTFLRGVAAYAGGPEAMDADTRTFKNLEGAICEEIRRCVSKDLPVQTSSYHALASWIGSIPRDFPIEIFTPNYDLLAEQALEDLRVPYFDGFLGARYPFFDPYAVEFDTIPSRWARLWKIHGSINWRRKEDDNAIRIWRGAIGEGEELVIHPSHLKYDQSRRLPYMALMDRLRRFLSKPSSALIIVGYSFRDQHLNDVIIEGLQGSPSSAAFALMYSELDEHSEAKSLAQSRSNLSVLAADGAVIGTRPAEWETATGEPDSEFPAHGITWEANGTASATWEARFNLGDFSIFAELLREIAGRSDTFDDISA